MKKILLIEGNLDNAILIIELLEPYGCAITHAIDAVTGFWIGQQMWFDLVLLDIGLPDMPGSAIAGPLRNLSSNWEMPIIAMTADTAEETMREAIASGCDEVIHKPIDTRALADLIAWYLQVQEG